MRLPRRLHRAALGLASAALLVPVAAGCGDEASAAEIVAGAPEATLEQPSARMAMTMDMSDVPGAGGLVIEGEGAIEFGSGRSAIRVDLGDLLVQAGAPEGLDGTLETRMDGTTMYMTGETFTAGLGVPPGTWLAADLREMAEMNGFDLGAVQQPGSNDPRQSLAILNGVAEDGVEQIGEDRVRGADTTHYRAEVDLRKAVEESGGVVDEEAFRRFAEALGDEPLQVEVWIDSEGRMRQLDMGMPLPAASDPAGQATVRMELFDFGSDVDVAPPPAGRTRDLRELMAQAGVEPGA